MMWYRYEIHMHSKEGSKCGQAPLADLVRAYHAAGYAGGVLTDHFIFGNTAIPRDLPWEEQMQGYYDAYLSAKAVADELDFDLIFGIEHQYGNFKEILIYGMDVDFWKANPDIPELDVHELADRVHAAGGYISHAHPFRFKSYMTHYVDPTVDMVDALEIYNFSDSDESNAKAKALAEEMGLPGTAGGDTHWADSDGIGQAGIALPYRVHDTKELAKAMHKGDFKPIVRGKIVL